MYETIFEARSGGSLFHGTTYANAASILEENILKGRTICFARVLSSSFYNVVSDCIFEIDKQKFDIYQSKNCFSRPFKHEDYEGESEERITFHMGKSFDNFLFFIKKIIINIPEWTEKEIKQIKGIKKIKDIIQINKIPYEIRYKNFTKINIDINDFFNYVLELNDLFGERTQYLIKLFLSQELKSGYEHGIAANAIGKIKENNRHYYPDVLYVLETLLENKENLNIPLEDLDYSIKVFKAIREYLRDPNDWEFMDKVAKFIK
jgi:hypothetical protein